jgi:putative membrane protein
LAPEDNNTSKTLAKQADETRLSLAKLDGAEFDRTYAENEVAYHQTVNDSLQNTLIPAASNAELKDLLSTGLIQGHEQHAEHLIQTMK